LQDTWSKCQKGRKEERSKVGRTDVNDMRKGEIINWSIEAKDRDGWWKMLEDTTAHLEL